MQYILTEEEYKKLNCINPNKVVLEKKVLQKFCTFVANTTPVDRYWDKENKSPWGCILNDGNSSGYCDECPADDLCPCERKEYSQ